MIKKPIWIGLMLLPLLCSMLWEKNRPVSFPQTMSAMVYDSDSLNMIELGRMLFYDPILSADSSTSCASCHSVYNAFAHVDHDLSHGIRDQIGKRNAPGLFNLKWQSIFMWDGAVNHIDVQALAPITNPLEMDESLAHVVSKLSAQNHYRRNFNAVYGDSVVTGERVLKAIAAFQLSLVSLESKYDQVMRGEDTFSMIEQKGYALFQQHCAACHREPLFTDHSFRNNGLPVDTTLNDWGRYKITLRSEDSLKFKVPSLRNVEYTFPYMHDGRYKSLYEVLGHYIGENKNAAEKDAALNLPLSLTSDEQTELVAFLLTLSDKEFVFNKAYGYRSSQITITP
jgi:cytochrome c peroxidase